MGLGLRNPLGHLKEYVRILKALLQQGEVDLDGEFYQAHESIPEPVDVPVNGPRPYSGGSFELCGAEADGAIYLDMPARLPSRRWPARHDPGRRGGGTARTAADRPHPSVPERQL